MEKKMSNTQFWVRLSVWIILCLIVPIVYLAVAYGLFNGGNGETSVSFSGWGTLGIVFAVIILLYIVNQTRKALPYGSMAKQCISGIMALLPLVGIILLIENTKANMDKFERFLIVVTLCEAVAVPVNPLPRWGVEHGMTQMEGMFSRAIKSALGKDNGK